MFGSLFIGLLSEQKVLLTIKFAWQTLHGQPGIKTPRIAVAGLHPHAGEGGVPVVLHRLQY